MRPHYTHDCEHCTFLGTVRVSEKVFDLYHCGISTVLARYGNDGPDYSSGLAFATFDGIPALYIAKQLAEINGVIFK